MRNYTNERNKNYLLLIIWILSFLFISWVIGSFTKSEVTTWYKSLNRSFLTPPNYIFPIAWTILYSIIAVFGWELWRQKKFSELRLIKKLYIIQMILNWLWTPFFFHYHLTGLSFVILLIMDLLVAVIIYFSYNKVRVISVLMGLYLAWILFATYLNFYIWKYN